MTPCPHRFATSGLRRFKIPDLHRFATSGLHGFKIQDLHRFAASGLRGFKISDPHRFATSGLRGFKIPDLLRVNYPENSFHEFRQTRRFEGDRFLLNSPTVVLVDGNDYFKWLLTKNGLFTVRSMYLHAIDHIHLFSIRRSRNGNYL
jgi:hypothetical protein